MIIHFLHIIRFTNILEQFIAEHLAKCVVSLNKITFHAKFISVYKTQSKVNRGGKRAFRDETAA